MEQLSEKLFDFVKNIPRSYYLPIGLALAGFVFLSIGLIQLSAAHTSDTTASVSSSESPATASASLPSAFGMQVDVEGAVASPGVYKLPSNARVQDGLIAAGGLSASADREVIAKSINLAAKLTDGVKIYVPKVGDVQANNVASSGTGNASSVLGAASSLVNINSATAAELDNLPGIGPVSAQKIIAARPFSSTDDLLTKKVVSNSTFQKIKDLVTIY